MRDILGAMGLLGSVAIAALAAAVALPAVPARPPITAVSHIAVYTADPTRSERFYIHDLGGVKGEDPEDPRGVRYYFSRAQFVEVLPLPAGSTSINRLDHVAFVTSDVERLRKYLSAERIAAPKQVTRGHDGSLWIDVTDPEGNKIEFVQPPTGDSPETSADTSRSTVPGALGTGQRPSPQPAIPGRRSGRDGAPDPLSHHIIHVGFIIHDRALEDSFFRTLLGFKPYWFGGNEDNRPTWISQQVPDGTDWLEYMIVGTAQGRGIPPGMSHADLGVLNHFALGISNAEATYTLLWNGGRLDGQTNTPKIGRDAKWQLNLLDPDGTRAELMELHAIGKPCCSPFTAPDPQN